MEEPGWGADVVNDSTYGHDVTRTVRTDGDHGTTTTVRTDGDHGTTTTVRTDGDHGTTTTVRLSLLRAPRFPDPETDQGVHRFRHALVPGAGIGDAVREGWRINLPERRITGEGEVSPLVTVDRDAVVITAVKLADGRRDHGGEAGGRRQRGRGGAPP